MSEMASLSSSTKRMHLFLGRMVKIDWAASGLLEVSDCRSLERGKANPIGFRPFNTVKGLETCPTISHGQALFKTGKPNRSLSLG